MPRARNIKPGFFKNELLVELPFEQRLLFIGLWTIADREGRFEYRPKRLKAELFPYELVNIDDAVSALVEAGFIYMYEANGKTYCQIINWAKHQNPHHKEIASVIPAPANHVDTVCMNYVPLNNGIRQRIYARDGRVCKECGAEHGLSIDHIVPVSKGGNSTDDNLQVLCLSCNTRKGNRISSKTYVSIVDDSSKTVESNKQNASCPTDSGFLIPDSGFPSKPSPALPDWLPKDAWNSFVKFRKKRKGWTLEAEALNLRTLTELRRKGHDPTAVLEQSIEKGWAGLFELKTERKRNGLHEKRANTIAGLTGAKSDIEGTAERVD